MCQVLEGQPIWQELGTLETSWATLGHAHGFFPLKKEAINVHSHCSGLTSPSHSHPSRQRKSKALITEAPPPLASVFSWSTTLDAPTSSLPCAQHSPLH